MKTLLLAITFAAALIFAQEEKKYGAEISLVEKTTLSQISANPQDYVGKTVLVEGNVLSVCKMAGCWMEIESDEPGEKMRVKVKDGEITFPMEAVGNKAVVEGEVYAIEMNEEDAREFYAHMAEDAGEEFDKSTITGPMTIYQIKGLGAVISFDADVETETEVEIDEIEED